MVAFTIATSYHVAMGSKIIPITKTDTQLQIAYGEVYLPNMPDSDNDFMSPITIRITAHTFLKSLQLHNIDVHHDNVLIDAAVVESFIAIPEDPVFVADAWVVGVHIADPDTWAKVLSGELNGFSLEALVHRQESELEITIPEYVQGTTSEIFNHTHIFIVKFGPEGEFLGGQTDEVNDHFHMIIRGTATESVNDHSHRFTFVEAFYE